MAFLLIIGVIALILIFKGVVVIQQNTAYVVERFGKFEQTLNAGLHFIVPFIDKVAYKHSLKEVALDIAAQSAITKDNVKLDIDGLVYLKVIDPYKASYGVQNQYFAITQLAQTTMRSEIGKISLDKTFEERDNLNISIVDAINLASDAWGVQCLRYEIKDISPPATILKAMELQVAAEREKRARILDSEGHRQAKINIAEADKQEQILQSEGKKLQQINMAEGEANAILQVAEARSEGIRKIASAIKEEGGSAAVSQQIAENYFTAWGKGMKEGTVIMLPNDTSNVSNMVATALTTFDSINQTTLKDVFKVKKS